jgi:hypothetical protein
MAATMFLVPSVTGVPFEPRRSSGPSALITASEPRIACWIRASSDSSPVTVTRRGSLWPSLSGLRTYAVTSWPLAIRSLTTSRPICPVAPKTVTFMSAPSSNC